MNEFSEPRKVDVICQCNADGKIIPIRVRFENEDGMKQIVTIKGFVDNSYCCREMPDGVFVARGEHAYECKVQVNGIERTMFLYYEVGRSDAWMMTSRVG